MLAAGLIYTGTTHELKGILPMLIIHGLALWGMLLPLLTPRWQQGIASLRRLLRKSGALT
jgi:hypothetical protein